MSVSIFDKYPNPPRVKETPNYDLLSPSAAQRVDADRVFTLHEILHNDKLTPEVITDMADDRDLLQDCLEEDEMYEELADTIIESRGKHLLLIKNFDCLDEQTLSYLIQHCGAPKTSEILYWWMYQQLPMNQREYGSFISMIARLHGIAIQQPSQDVNQAIAINEKTLKFIHEQGYIYRI